MFEDGLWPHHPASIQDRGGQEGELDDPSLLHHLWRLCVLIEERAGCYY